MTSTEARVATGIKKKYGVSRLKASTAIMPTYRPDIGVFTPLALLTADLVNAPQMGIDLTHDPIKLHRPNVNISWDASTALPEAIIYKCECKYD